MRIGIDARPLCSPITGIGRYLLEVVKALSQMPNVSLVLYVPKPILADLDLGSVTIRECYPSKILPAYLVPFWWLLLALPKAIYDDRLDIFWSCRHSLPRKGKNKFPYVMTINDLVAYKFPKTMRWLSILSERIFLPFSIKRADHIIAISRATKRDILKQFGMLTSAVSVVHLAPTLNKANTPLPSNIRSGYILSIGTLEPRKNLTRLLNAYLSLPVELRQQHQLVFVGGTGWKSDALRQQIAALATESQVIYLGYQADAELFTLMRNAIILAYPSLYEGFGLPLVDAIRAGIPILTSTDPACVEIAGEAAVIADPLSVRDIANKLEGLLINSQLRAQLAMAGLQRSQQFSWQKTAGEHLKIFISCVERFRLDNESTTHH